MSKKEHLIDVQLISSKTQIEDMKWALERHCSKRDYILLLMIRLYVSPIYTALIY